MSLSALKAAEVPKLSWSQWAQMAYQHCSRPQVSQSISKHSPWIQKAQNHSTLQKVSSGIAVGCFTTQTMMKRSRPSQSNSSLSGEFRGEMNLGIRPSLNQDLFPSQKIVDVSQKLQWTGKGLAVELKSESLKDSDQSSPALSAEPLQIGIKDVSHLTEQY